MLAHKQQNASHVTSKTTTVGQFTTFYRSYFRIEFAFHYSMKILPCYYAVRAHYLKNSLADINKKFQKWDWLEISLSIQSVNI